jgi:uncharacterized membrane protein
MNQKLVISAALTAALAAASVSTVAVAADKVKCYGAAKAGQNDCADLRGTHSCAGYAKMDYDPAEWKLVDAAECTGEGKFSDKAAAKAAVAALDAAK